MNRLRNVVAMALVTLGVSALYVFSSLPEGSALAAAPGGGVGRGPGSPGAGRGRGAAIVDPNPRTVAPYFKPATAEPKSPDAEGFLQRWLLLEPITNGLRTNAGFNEAFIRSNFKSDQFKDLYTALPKNGDKVKVNDQELAWHALDSNLFNVKLFRFAYGTDKTVYGVTFFAVTVVEAPREMPNVRLAMGSNSASMWWVNGQEAVGLFGDRRMVMDDCVSKRLTLKKGKNIVRGVVINGPGMSDFCARFIDEQGEPVKDITLTLEMPQN